MIRIIRPTLIRHFHCKNVSILIILNIWTFIITYKHYPKVLNILSALSERCRKLIHVIRTFQDLIRIVPALSILQNLFYSSAFKYLTLLSVRRIYFVHSIRTFLMTYLHYQSVLSYPPTLSKRWTYFVIFIRTSIIIYLYYPNV